MHKWRAGATPALVYGSVLFDFCFSPASGFNCIRHRFGLVANYMILRRFRHFRIFCWENNHPEINVVRVGLNYLFNFAPSAPVVAKY